MEELDEPESVPSAPVTPVKNELPPLKLRGLLRVSRKHSRRSRLQRQASNSDALLKQANRTGMTHPAQ